MAISFDINDILKVAVKIEENGETFYHYAEGITKNKDTKKLFKFLADEEANHKKTFEDMLSKIDKSESLEGYPEEYLTYLRTYVDKVIFTKKAKKTDFSAVKDTLSAINFAIQRELDSILYYQEMKRLVHKSQESIIERIIDEERRHFLKLQEIKKQGRA